MTFMLKSDLTRHIINSHREWKATQEQEARWCESTSVWNMHWDWSYNNAWIGRCIYNLVGKALEDLKEHFPSWSWAIHWVSERNLWSPWYVHERGIRHECCIQRKYWPVWNAQEVPQCSIWTRSNIEDACDKISLCYIFQNDGPNPQRGFW